MALSDDDWQKALNVNLLASVRLDRAFRPHDRTQVRCSFFTSRLIQDVCCTTRRPMLRPTFVCSGLSDESTGR